MTDEELLRALYGGLLGRQPDVLGFQQHAQWLQAQETNPQRYQQLIEAFAGSDEARLLRDRRALPEGSNLLLPDMSGVSFGHAIAMGNFCHGATVLKRLGMRRWSGPFDWLFSNIGMIAHCIDDDFATFLDSSHYRSVPVAERVSPEANFCHHEFYRERDGVQFVFNHHDPAASPDDAAHYGRAVDRMRTALRSPAWKLLVMVSVNPVDLRRLKPLLDALDKTSSRFVLLVLQFTTAGAKASPPLPGRLRTERLRHDVLKVELNVSSPSNGVEFADPEDERLLERVLRSFRFQPESQPA